METKNTNNLAYAPVKTSSSERRDSFSFLTFRKAIKANSEIRRQIRDIVDLGLFEYAFRKNNDFIQSVLQNTEKESLELMMRFTNGVDDFQKLQDRIHKNRIIRILAMRDKKDQTELIQKLTHQGT
jgi:hypothetical protein